MAADGTVLIIDDDEDILDLLNKYLAPHFSKILRAANGRDALNLHRATPADVIISDLRMPEMTGQELLKALRDEGDETPFIILTGFADTENAVAALRLGAFDFFVKPLQDKSIVEKAREACMLRTLMREAEQEVERMVADGRLPAHMSPGTYAAAKHVAYLKRVNQRIRDKINQ